MKTPTNEQVFEEIRKSGFITQAQISLLAFRSNREGKDIMDYNLMEEMGDRGIPLTSEQGLKGLKYLKRFFKHSCKESLIINNSTSEDFTFRGFYNIATLRCFYVPVYTLKGELTYYVKLGKPRVILW